MSKEKFKIKSLKFKVGLLLLRSLFSLFAISLFLLTANAQSIIPVTANAGANTNVCPGDSAKIGGSPSATGGIAPYTYSWQPSASVDFSNAANPNAFPATATNYTLTATDAAGNSAVDVVNVSLFSPPVVSAGSDQTILQGSNTMLLGTGAVNYYWTPPQSLYNQNTATPVAEPSATTIFCVLGLDGNGCSGADCMTLFVIPSDTIIIFNAFTPNSDGFNDFFYIGNIASYSENKIEIFNRNGKLVYQASPYRNDWIGRIDGVELPAATYYFVLTPGSGKEKINGAITIIR